MKKKGGQSSNNFFTSHTRKNSPTPSSSTSPFSSPQRTAPSTPLHTFSASMMEENVNNAETMINKWDIDNPSSSFTRVASLFYDDRREAKEFLKCVKDLQRAMRFFINEDASSFILVRSQNLTETAMKRLQKEFYQILSANRDNLDPESVSSRLSHEYSDKSRSSTTTASDCESEDEIRNAPGDLTSEADDEEEVVATVAMTDLRLIAECMISSGYGRECVKIYKIIRKSIVDEALYRLGVERLTTAAQINKMDWEILDFKIKNWLYGVKVAVKSILSGERILCDHVFAVSESSRESCFTEIAKEAAISLFQFPELVAKGKKSPEKMFRILDLYNAISEMWPEIQSIFYFESTAGVRSQALSSLLRLGDAVRLMLTDFESAIQKDTSKIPVPGGGLHPLTRYVMNYICFLSDYCGILSDILADWPLPVQSPFPDSYFGSPDAEDSPLSVIAVRFAWLILVLLCKLDGKAELYKDVSLSYLFLANNLHYVISKVSKSNLRFLLGEEWMSNHEQKVRQYTANYERMAWSKVIASLPANPTAVISPEAAKEGFRSFSSAFETAYHVQSSWVVPDTKLRDNIKVSICKKLVPAYRAFYDRNLVTLRGERNLESLVRFSPDDLGNYLSDLFYGAKVSGSTSATSSSHGGSAPHASADRRRARSR